jgi:hypothetical protein
MGAEPPVQRRRKRVANELQLGSGALVAIDRIRRSPGGKEPK